MSVVMKSSKNKYFVFDPDFPIGSLPRELKGENIKYVGGTEFTLIDERYVEQNNLKTEVREVGSGHGKHPSYCLILEPLELNTMLMTVIVSLKRSLEMEESSVKATKKRLEDLDEFVNKIES